MTASIGVPHHGRPCGHARKEQSAAPPDHGVEHSQEGGPPSRGVTQRPRGGIKRLPQSPGQPLVEVGASIEEIVGEADGRYNDKIMHKNDNENDN